MTRELGPTRAAAATHPIAVVAALVAANVAIAAFVVGRPELAPLALAALVAFPILAALAVKLVERPQRGVLLLAALIPLDGLHEIVPYPSGWKEALVLVTLAATFVAPPEARAAPGRRLPSWAIVVGALFALGVVSAVGVGPEQGLVGLRVIFFYVLVALTVWRCPLGARERDQLVTILMVMGVITAAFGIAQQLIGETRLVDFGYSFERSVRTAGGYLRSFSTFFTNFPFALFLMLVLLIGIPSALVDPKRLRNRLFLLSTPVLLGGLVASITRAAWFGLAVGVVYIGVTRFRSLLVVLAHSVVWIALALIVAAGIGGVFLSGESLQERFDIWGNNVSQIAEHPVGQGIGSTGSAADKLTEQSGKSTKDVLQPDNYYLKTTLELGVLGLWLLLLLFVTAFSSVHSAARRLRGYDGALATGVAASVLAAAVVSLVATYFEVFPMDAYFWLLLAVVATCVPESR
ncbi:MAG TPA: O-antigen ligase family protein [Acidimicrobiia bacterium]|nr:O-antigen ligase family protein [Acidimicrobiia bacterium]